MAGGGWESGGGWGEPAPAAQQQQQRAAAAAEEQVAVLFKQLATQQDLLEGIVCRASKAESEADDLRQQLAAARQQAKRAAGQASALEQRLRAAQTALAHQPVQAGTLLSEQQETAAGIAARVGSLRDSLAPTCGEEAATIVAALDAEVQQLQGQQAKLRQLLKYCGRQSQPGLAELSPSQGPPEPLPTRRLYFGKLAPGVTRRQLSDAASEYGVVESVKVCVKGDRTYGFVEFEEAEAAEAAVAALNGRSAPELSGPDKLVVQFCKAAPPPEARRQPQPPDGAGTAAAAAAAVAAAAAAVAAPAPALAANSGKAAGRTTLQVSAPEWRPPAAQQSSSQAGEAAAPHADAAAARGAAAAAAAAAAAMPRPLDTAHKEAVEEEGGAAEGGDLPHLPAELLDSPPHSLGVQPATPSPLPLPLPLTPLSASSRSSSGVLSASAAAAAGAGRR